MIKLDLPEVGRTDALEIESGLEAICAIRNDLAATFAGSNGAINVYVDSDSNITCEAIQNLVTKDLVVLGFSDKEEIVKWVDKYISDYK